jgi:hypothetical protein
MSPVDPRRWTFILPTPGGDINCTYDLTPVALEFESDSVSDGGHHSVAWSAIAEAGTAALDMPVGRGAPDLGRFVPPKLEWLIASRSDASKPFMHPLPPPPQRDALIASVRDGAGERWVGENIPLATARSLQTAVEAGTSRRRASSSACSPFFSLLLILLASLLSPVFLFPAGFLLRAGCFAMALGLATPSPSPTRPRHA